MNRPLHSVVTACGNVLRGEFKGLDIESDGKTWVNIIDDESRVESCTIDADGDVISETGEVVTNNWTDDDWAEFKKFVRGT